jgi:signal transduction histidine kinase
LTEWANVTDLALEIAASDGRIQVEAPARPVMTTLNRTAGIRILAELVENALAFSPADGSVVIRVSAQDNDVEVRVIDEGCGVDPLAAERIFEPLEQAEDLLTRTHQGAGLGLSLARMSARVMDGDVTLEDTGPGGSVFLWRVSGMPSRLASVS